MKQQEPAPEQIDAYLDGQLDDKAAGIIERHLAACAECREYASRVRALSAAFGRLQRHSAPRQLLANIKERVGIQERRRFFARRLTAGLAVAAVVLLAVAVTIYEKPWRTERQAARPASAPAAAELAAPQAPAQPEEPPAGPAPQFGGAGADRQDMERRKTFAAKETAKIAPAEALPAPRAGRAVAGPAEAGAPADAIAHEPEGRRSQLEPTAAPTAPPPVPAQAVAEASQLAGAGRAGATRNRRDLMLDEAAAGPRDAGVSVKPATDGLAAFAETGKREKKDAAEREVAAGYKVLASLEAADVQQAFKVGLAKVAELGLTVSEVRLERERLLFVLQPAARADVAGAELRAGRPAAPAASTAGPAPEKAAAKPLAAAALPTETAAKTREAAAAPDAPPQLLVLEVRLVAPAEAPE